MRGGRVAPHREDFDVYYADAECRIAAARADPDRSTGDKHHMIFITNVPWLSFTAVTHPFSAQYASIPILTLGKFFTQGAQVVLPLAVQVHHGLADGWHVGRFYDEVHFTQGAQVVLPLAVQVHHGLADGWHVGRFYDEVQRLVAEPSFLRPNPGLPGRLRER
ncbi:MAG: CatA-like O-acetyltransferase [Chromatiaceae bacterium]